MIDYLGEIALFAVGYVAGVVTVITWALMNVSSRDSRRREQEEQSQAKIWAKAGDEAARGLEEGMKEYEEQEGNT